GRRHRTEKFKEGHIKHCGEPKLTWMREGFAIAKVKLGVIGVKVLIMESDAELPDEIRIIPPTEEEVIEEVSEGVIEGEAKKAESEDIVPEMGETEKEETAEKEASPESEKEDE
ncbi:MAG: 30S ribosomal protein S3, partial [Thermoplasmata archaeon]